VWVESRLQQLRRETCGAVGGGALGSTALPSSSELPPRPGTGAGAGAGRSRAGMSQGAPTINEGFGGGVPGALGEAPLSARGDGSGGRPTTRDGFGPSRPCTQEGSGGRLNTGDRRQLVGLDGVRPSTRENLRLQQQIDGTRHVHRDGVRPSPRDSGVRPSPRDAGVRPSPHDGGRVQQQKIVASPRQPGRADELARSTTRDGSGGPRPQTRDGPGSRNVGLRSGGASGAAPQPPPWEFSNQEAPRNGSKHVAERYGAEQRLASDQRGLEPPLEPVRSSSPGGSSCCSIESIELS